MATPTYLSHPPSYRWRPVEMSDIPAIQQMIATTLVVDQVEAVASAERMEQILSMVGDQLVTHTRAALLPNGEIVAIGLIFTRSDEEEHTAMFNTIVHGEHRGQGVETMLLQWIEERVRQAFAELADGKPQLIRVGCPDHLVDQIALYEQSGFQPVRYAYKMQRELGAFEPEKALPTGLRLVQWSEACDPALRQTFNVAFQGHWGLPEMTEALWQQFLVGVPQFRGDLTFLALDSDESDRERIVGFCLNWVDEDKNAQTGVGEGWIEAIGVIPTWRGRGIAEVLLHHTLNAFRAEGLDYAALDVDTQNPTGALRLYEKLGFAAVKRTIIFAKNLN